MTYCADFETTGKLNLEKDGRVRVWLWSLVNCDTKEEWYGYDIQTFLDRIKELRCDKIFFHNLRFDGYFLLYYLAESGYIYGTDYTCIIDNLNTYYEIKIINGKDVTKIWDSLKKFPGQSVQSIAKMYKIEGKKERPYFEMYRPPDYIPTPEEIEYCLQDSRIIAHAIQHEESIGHKGMTLSSDAFNGVKQFIGGYRGWRNNFTLIDSQTDSFIRLSYKGGWVYNNPKYQNKLLHNTVSYDVNSLYPWVMHDCLLPFGPPILEKPRGKQQYVIQFNCEFELKEGYLPTIQVKHNPIYRQTEYLTESMGITQLTMTNIDFELFLEHYDVLYMDEPKYITFTSKVGLLAKYIDYWTEQKIKAKENHNDAMYYLSKRWLNSPYGKTGMRPDRINKIPGFTDEGMQFECVDEETDGIYIPYATFVCAQARNKTLRAAQKEYDNFIYADTDSIHLTEETDKIDIDDYKLGYWKLEGHYPLAKYIRPKTYIHAREDKSVMEIKCAGMPDSIKSICSFDDFHDGMSWSTGKLMQKHVTGGCLLVDTGFTIKQ